ncbi:hypothetical protein VOLCADRAFT_119317 [Volvox carteri f. nagariensis]|uniref:HIG1 domain-containing protein n=1 Tax=Volvox carteri f. nagariensis TaxID=3068 RepID=D8UC52_VOLCA|nr:uncharacterized protein VOLCADRAFT_119317 [Volvox carteri f. nagariensis]EFJ42782.1 hypothetical protein VOLCADRAFT_119317 [Volvox carteri f. nagariensis]|eukprot:XP_002956243.1 hypothetical protein VOLCADRAFT_119317 [Volvox carteri f. nagariensis]
MPRQRAKPPMMAQTEAALRKAAEKPPVQLSRDQVSRAYDILEQQRIGPYAVKYGCIGSVGLVAYTYLRGFYHLAQKNREAWMGTFRHRIMLLGPLIAMYATANDVIPLPYKERVEAALNRQAISMYDIVTAKETVRKAQVLPLSAQM